MNTKETRSRRSLRLAPLSLLGLSAATALTGGCLTRPLETLETHTTWTTSFKQTRSGVDKIDLVLMIDNSGSMADKQAILADAVPNLVRGLLNPPCIGKDDLPIAAQPASPADACPAGSAREFEPIYDVHIGIVSSSLGGHGSSACPVRKEPLNPADVSYKASWSNDDGGHLLDRVDAKTPDQQLETYQGLGFLAWDPKQALTPPGESSLDAAGDKLRNMVRGVGQIGCGYESQLESWYRFLVDPEPYKTIRLEDNQVVVEGVDEELLAERAAFLRPDSLVAILMLTDENDCSTREERFYPVINNLGNKMPRARSICATDPDSRCCAPCGNAPAECPADSICDVPLTPEEDPINLRCHDQKKRFGWDFLYPTERYVQALTSPLVQKRNGEVVQNPLFPVDPTGAINARRPEQGNVFLAGIVGVPWQDIARQRADGTPDLLSGLDDDGKPVGGFMSASELSARNPVTKATRWDVILGDPAKHVPPSDPLMIESRLPRTGANPVTGEAVGPVGAASASENSINGHEWNTDTAKDSNGHPHGDLQYACVFDLKAGDQRDCDQTKEDCDCVKGATSGSANPLCQSKDSGAYSSVQRRAKGYPGLRQLAVLQGVREQGIVASVCPAQVEDPTRRDYGYNPAIGSIIDRLKHKLTGQCLNRRLSPDKDGHVECLVLEARKGDGGVCCDGVARRPVSAEHEHAVEIARIDPSAAGADCFCEIAQLSGDDLGVCQNDVSVVPVGGDGEPVDGWCYVDRETGDPALIEGCAASEPYKLRFVGAGQPQKDAVTFITCAGDT